MLKIISIVLIVIVGINTILTAIKWRKSSLMQKIMTVSGILLVLITGYYAWNDFKQGKNDKSIKSKVGELKTLNDYNNLTITFNFGNNSFYKSIDGDLEFPGYIQKGKYLKAWINNKKLFLNMIICNGTGDIIGTIEGQTWKVYYSEYDYNNDDKGFEIVTPDKKVISQIFLKDNVVYVRGLVLSDQKFGYYIYASPDNKGADLEVLDISKKVFEIPNKVPKIFKYPRETNYGVRDLNNPLNN